jgi:hypothetical protein
VPLWYRRWRASVSLSQVVTWIQAAAVAVVPYNIPKEGLQKLDDIHLGWERVYCYQFLDKRDICELRMLTFIEIILQEKCQHFCSLVIIACCTHKYGHYSGHHKIWTVSIAVPTLQSWFHTMRLSTVWLCKNKLWGHHEENHVLWLQKKECIF